jgi:hypothetical protein
MTTFSLRREEPGLLIWTNEKGGELNAGIGVEDGSPRLLGVGGSRDCFTIVECIKKV